jgi:WD40 repeat protein
VYGVAFAPDGRTFATASADQTVRLWDLSKPDKARQLGPPLTGHTSAVYGVVVTPDGRTLASGSFDLTVRLWDISDRDRPLRLGQPLTDHAPWVNRVAFAPDGHTLATASTDQTIRLWDLGNRAEFRDGEVREACLRAGGPLDEATWYQYAPGVGYQDTCADR